MSEHTPELPISSEFDPTTIPQPVIITDGYVRNIFNLPDDQSPDYTRNTYDAVKMQERLEPATEPKFRVGLVESGRSTYAYGRIWDGTYKQVRRLQVVKGEYVVSRKWAAAVLLGSAVVFNLVGNIETLEAVADGVVYGVQDHTHTETTIVDTVRYGKSRKSTEVMHAPAGVGKTSVDKSKIADFVSRLHQDQLKGASVTSIEVIGDASDEDGRKLSSIGKIDEVNQRLAKKRASAAVQTLKAEGINSDKYKIKQSVNEHVMTEKTVLTAMEKEATRLGYDDLISAIRSADVGELVDPTIKENITEYFTGTNNRGVTMKANLNFAGPAMTTHNVDFKQVSDGDVPPLVPKPSFYGFIPLLPIRRRRMWSESRPHFSHQLLKQPLLIPRSVKESEDRKFIKVYDDGVNQDGSLKQGALWHTDKFEYMLREDDRLRHMIKVSLTDAEGKPQEIRAVFVDNDPSEKERQIFAEEIARLALFDNGKMAEAVNTIMIYPSDSAGIEHQDPSKVAIGVDKQLGHNILGAYNPVLKTVEIVTPTDWSAEAMHELFQSFNGPTSIIRHEMGHGLARKTESYEFRRAHIKGGERTYVIATNNVNAEIESTVAGLKPLDLTDQPVEFATTYTVQDEAGQTAEISTMVSAGDARLNHAKTARIIGRHVLPRHGSLLNRSTAARRRLAAEEFADSFSGLVGKGIPFATAGIRVPEIVMANGRQGSFTRWFLPSRSMQTVIEKVAVAKPDSSPLKSAYQTEVSVKHLDPRTDSLIGNQMVRARNAHSSDGRRYVTYLANVSYAKKSDYIVGQNDVCF